MYPSLSALRVSSASVLHLSHVCPVSVLLGPCSSGLDHAWWGNSVLDYSL